MVKNGYGLDRRPLSLGEAELEKVIRQSFNAEGTFSEESLSRKREAA